MRASDGGTARRMETKKGLPKQSFFQVVLPGQRCLLAVHLVFFISLDNQHFEMFDYTDSIK